MRVERATMVLVAVAGLAIPAMAQDSVSQNGGLPGDALDPYEPDNQCKNYQADLAPRYGSWPGTRFGIVPIMKSSKINPLFFSSLISAQHVSNDTISSQGDNIYKRWHGGVVVGGGLVDWYGVNTAENADPNFPDVLSVPDSLQLAGAFSEFDGDHNGGLAAIIEYDRTCPNRLLVRRRIAAVKLDALGGNPSNNIAFGTIDADGNMYIRSDDFGIALPVWIDDNIYRVRTLDRNCQTVNQIGVTFDATDHLVIASGTVHTVPGNVPQSAAGNADGTYAGVDFSGNFITNDTAVAPSTNHGGASWRPLTSSSRGNVGTSIHTFPHFNPTGAGRATFGLITENNAADQFKERVSVWGVDGTGSVTAAETYPLSGLVITNGCDGHTWDTGVTAINPLSEFDHYHSQVSFQGGNGQIGIGRDGSTGDLLVAGILYADGGITDNPINALVVRRIDANTGVPIGNDWELVANVDQATGGGAGMNTPIHGDYGNDGAAFSGDAGEFDGILDLDPASPTYDAPIGEITPLFNVAPLFGPSMSTGSFDGMGNLYFVSAVVLRKWDSANNVVFDDFDSALLKAHYVAIDDDAPAWECPTGGWRLELLLELGSTTKGRNSTYDYQIQFMGVADSNSVSSGTLWSGNVTNENWNKHTPGFLNTAPGGSGREDNRALGGMIVSVSITYDRDRDGVFDDALGVDEDYNVALWVGYRPCLADVTTQGAPAGDPLFGVPDELVTGADILYYVNQWVVLHDKADITTQGAGVGDVLFDIPDGIVTASDIQRFVNAWIGGCD